jgi:DNA polymerase III subunit beta
LFIKVSQSDLMGALQIVQRGTSSQSTLPILAGIKIMAEKPNNLVLQGTDLELSIETSCEATVKTAGAVVVGGKLFVDIFRHLPDGAIEISMNIETGHVDIKAGKSSFSVKTMPAEDFPSFPEVTEKNTLELESQTLLGLVKQTIKAVSKDETRPVLTGALLDVESDNILMVATDSYRLAVKTARLAKKAKQKLKALIPYRALEEAQKLPVGDKDLIKLAGDEGLLGFSSNRTTIVTRLIEGQYPNYKQLIPEETTLRVEADKNELLGAIVRVALLAQKNMSVKVALGNGKIQIKAATQGVGEADEEVKAEISGEKTQEMAFNAQYLMDGLQGATGERVALEFTGPTNPGLIKSIPDDSYLYLIMPIRLT